MGASLRAFPPTLDVLVISTVIALVAVAAMPDAVFIEEMQEPVTRRGEPVEITTPPEQVAYWGRLLALLATLITHPLVAFSIAGLLTLVFGILGGGMLNFRQLLSITAHAMLIPAAGTLLSTLLRLTTHLSFEGSWLAALLGGPVPAGLAWGVLYRLDPFILWAAVAAGIGVHALDPRRPRAAAPAIVVGLYLLLVLGSAALAA